MDGVKVHKCVLHDFIDGKIYLMLAEDDAREFEKADFSSIKLDDFDGKYDM